MIGTNGVLTGEYLKKMIKKYASRPDDFFSNGEVNKEWLEELVKKMIAIDPKVCFGSARVKGLPRITVEDLIEATCSLTDPQNYVVNQRFGLRLPPLALDAAYAFFMLYPGKVAKDYENSRGKPLPQEIYS